MPTEVYPARMAHHDPYHDTSAAGFAPLPAMMGGWSSMPATGPARSIDCLPRQYPYHNGGRILPGGLRNPWAPYSGETYAPASDGAENIRLGAASAYGSLANVTGRTIGGGGSVIHPVQIGGGGSVVTGISGLTGRSVPSIGLGGLRNDDGWDGSVGRVHAGFSPDLTSTAGAIPRIAQSSHWLQSPSSPISPMNHARLTPILAPPPVYPVFAPGSLDRERARHPIDATRPKRIPSRQGREAREKQK
ncbi:hypothetical protein BD324DRAFT_652764 [Kockovaella imperatae]|uniref:Uncharacterized protein n=1 Tax=Kockovaella imperatae TaxID=4999 RepID=A0A1Y1UBZ4_9TREE|nr:hypothetical protein BD324DRAFT_652764 [Kockovaella imperatae]ORX35047.1 hypothetical protein BD324DRAFT_652764 [Kockovaella imperatae]